jgi:hypothetical protein
MTRQIQGQQLTAERQNSSYRSSPAHVSKQQSVKYETRPAATDRSSIPECERHLSEGKANRNIRITEIELCIGKHAAKQFSNRNKNAFFALLNAPGMREKRP